MVTVAGGYGTLREVTGYLDSRDSERFYRFLGYGRLRLREVTGGYGRLAG